MGARLYEERDKWSLRQGSPDPVAERSETVRRLNTQLRKLIEWLPHDSDYQCNFYCECGCCEPVLLTVAEYDSLGDKTLFRAGHATSGR